MVLGVQPTRGLFTTVILTTSSNNYFGPPPKCAIVSAMSMTDKLIGLVAPHTCMICGEEGSVVCQWCLPDFALPLPARCYRCKAVTVESLVCKSCRKTSRLRYVWVRASYEGSAKQLIHDFKFERKQAAAQPMVQMMAEALPYLPTETLIVHIPTATSRVRQRGYDHAELLARALAQELGLKHKTLLRRVTQTRQVGTKRSGRLAQMQDAFGIIRGNKSQKQQILLVDDLVTTGATIEAVAKCLKTAGAKTVNAVVFAQR
jgi:ComF family protein